MVWKDTWKVSTHCNNCLYTVNLQVQCFSSFGIPNENGRNWKESSAMIILGGTGEGSHSCNYHFKSRGKKRKQ